MEDGAKNSDPSAKDEQALPKSDPLPAHLAHHERPRYENDIDVSTIPDMYVFISMLKIRGNP